MNNLALNNDFPFAKVNGASSIQEVFEEWKKRGLVPTQVTADQLVQEIHIEHDALTGALTVKRTKIDPLQAMSILWESILVIAQNDLFSEPRTKLNSGNAAIALSLKGDTINAIHDPINDPVVLKGLLLADLIYLSQLTNSEHHIEEVLEFKPNESPKV